MPFKHVNNFTNKSRGESVTHAVVTDDNGKYGNFRTACSAPYRSNTFNEILPIPEPKKVTCHECIQELVYNKEETMENMFKYVGNYLPPSWRKGKKIHAILVDAHGCLKSACGSFFFKDTSSAHSPAKHEITCKNCRRSLMSLHQRGLLKPNILESVKNDNKESLKTDDKPEKPMPDNLGGKKYLIFYNDDGLMLTDDISRIMEEEGHLIDSVIVIDEFREYEVVEKSSYELEQVENE